MGANASSRAWPDDLVARLAERRRVLRYDHRNTGRFDEHPYGISELAADAVAVLDAFGVPQHLVAMSMGGLLAPLLLLDHQDQALLRMWAELDDPRDTALGRTSSRSIDPRL